MDGEFRTKAEEKAHLSKIVQEWNASRLDMFALTTPDKVNIFLFTMKHRVHFLDCVLDIRLKKHLKLLLSIHSRRFRYIGPLIL